MMKKYDEENGGSDVTPHNNTTTSSRASFCSDVSVASSTAPFIPETAATSSASVDDVGARNNINNKMAAGMLTRQAVASVTFALVGWYAPKYASYHEQRIQHKPVPYQKTAAGDIILDFLSNQPLVDPATIPSSFLIITSIWLPIVLIIALSWWTATTTTTKTSSSSWRSSLVTLHGRLCGFCTAIGLSEGITATLKLLIQRRRPNFYAMCGFDTQQLKCTAPLNRIREANFSFPSGHSSLSCCAMTFLVWMFLGMIVASSCSSSSRSSAAAAAANKKGSSVAVATTTLVSGVERMQLTALLASVLPLSWAMFVGASRLMDHWHHPADVAAGLVLGGLMGTIGYHVWFPPVWWGQHVTQPWSVHFLFSNNSRPPLTPSPSMLLLSSTTTAKHTSFNE